jgi:glycosyltransferase involved in cell wall biosynthesis
MRVLLLTQWFDPEPTFKGLVFAKELMHQGFDVEVVTGFPNYPGGKVYPGYRIKWLQKEVVDGVHITRVPLYPSHDQSAIKRIFNYLSFFASSLAYCLFMAKRADAIYAYHPPLTVGITAGLVRLIRRIPVVYDIQDMWPDTLRATGMIHNPFVIKMIAVVCQLIYKRVDRIVVLSPGFRDLLIKRGVPDRKIDVIYNWADETSLMTQRGVVPDIFCANDRFLIMFAGNMGKAQALDSILEAARILDTRDSMATFVLIGGGLEVERLKQRVLEIGLNNVTFLPPVPMSDIGSYLHAADALLVHLRKDPLFEITIPSKTQAYMVIGKPILMAVDGNAADLIRQSGGGVVVESENASALAEAVLSMEKLSSEERNEMGRKAVEFYRKHLSQAEGVKRFISILRIFAKT